MKRVTIVRHAKSSWKDARLSDRERPLSKRGLRDAPRMGERLRARKARPSLILTSPAVRAYETARILARALGYPKEFLQTEPTLYHADVGTLFDIVTSQNDSFSDLMIVGHNPGLTWFVNEVLPDLSLSNLPTTGVVAIDFDSDHWWELGEVEASLGFYDYPKNPDVVLEAP